MAAEERWSFIEARHLENAARAAMLEFLPRLEDEGHDLEAEFEDTVLCDDADLRDRCVEEAGRRGESWRHIAWYEQLAEHAREERDMRLLRSATRLGAAGSIAPPDSEWAEEARRTPGTRSADVRTAPRFG